MKIIRKFIVQADDGRKNEFDNMVEAKKFLDGPGNISIYEWRSEWIEIEDIEELVKIYTEEVGTEQ